MADRTTAHPVVAVEAAQSRDAESVVVVAADWQPLNDDMSNRPRRHSVTWDCEAFDS